MVAKEQVKNIDVICQHTRAGKIIPLKIRMVDEDGELQSYLIQGYRDKTVYGSGVMPEGVTLAKNHMYCFECQILVFEEKRWIYITYNSRDNVWRITGRS